jgi:hypothetical protein
MSGIFWDTIMVLFIFGAVGQCFNEFHVLSVPIPDTGVTIQENQFREYQSSTNPTTVDDYTWTNIILIGLKVIGSAILAVFTIIPLVINLCMMVGVDFVTASTLALLIQVPVWLLCIKGWFELSTGRVIS